MAIKKRNILLSVIVATLAVAWFGIFPVLRAEGGSEIDAGSPLYTEFSRDDLQRITFDDRLAVLVDSARNIIIDETGSLAPFMDLLCMLRAGRYDGAVNILHIGDSHVQAGFWNGRMREHFNRDFGNGGRGLILPHRLTGTNEPRDYYIRTANSYEGFRTTSNPTREKLSFTGTGIYFDYNYPQVELWSREGFDAVTVISHPRAPKLSPPDSLLLDTQCVMGDTQECTTYYLNRMVDTLALSVRHDLKGTVPDDPLPLYYGFTLQGGTGVVYHSLGANSAAFEHFERGTTVCDGGAAQLFPDLIVISLGTNNCYGRNYRSDALRKVVERFFESITENYPGIPVLVTTPRESCQRSGRKYSPNPNIEDAAGVIRQAAARFNFACWDLYNAAGGRGIAEKWFDAGLSGRDRIHLTEAGYNLLGDMMYDALAQYYNDYISTPGNIFPGSFAYNLTETDMSPEKVFLQFTAQEITRTYIR